MERVLSLKRQSSRRKELYKQISATKNREGERGEAGRGDMGRRGEKGKERKGRGREGRQRTYQYSDATIYDTTTCVSLTEESLVSGAWVLGEEGRLYRKNTRKPVETRPSHLYILNSGSKGAYIYCACWARLSSSHTLILKTNL